MIEAVIIDFDDTLCLTEEATFGLENETLKRMGRPAMSREIHRETWGMPLGDAMLLRSPGVDVGEFWKFMPAVHEEFIRTGQIDIVTEANLQTLDRLARMGKQLMILTSRSKVEMNHLLASDHHLAGRIAAFYYKENMAFHKPDPRAFEIIEKDHGLTPDVCAYVGDSPSDAAAAKGAGLHFIASLEAGIRSKDDFDAYPVDRFIDVFSELDGAIAALDEKLRG